MHYCNPTISFKNLLTILFLILIYHCTFVLLLLSSVHCPIVAVDEISFCVNVSVITCAVLAAVVRFTATSVNTVASDKVISNLIALAPTSTIITSSTAVASSIAYVFPVNASKSVAAEAYVIVPSAIAVLQ